MASIFNQVPVYISVQEVIDSTSIADLSSFSDITTLINKAQINIDAYIRQTRWVWEATQQTIFPIQFINEYWDKVLEVPYDIKVATLYTVEYLFENWQDMTNSQYSIQSEREWQVAVSFWPERESTKWLGIPSIALSLLNKRKNVFYYQSV